MLAVMAAPKRKDIGVCAESLLDTGADALVASSDGCVATLLELRVFAAELEKAVASALRSSGKCSILGTAWLTVPHVIDMQRRTLVSEVSDNICRGDWRGRANIKPARPYCWASTVSAGSRARRTMMVTRSTTMRSWHGCSYRH